MNIPVLIVGAGPTGLMMACELARHGIDFRLIDKKSVQTRAQRTNNRSALFLLINLAANLLHILRLLHILNPSKTS